MITEKVRASHTVDHRASKITPEVEFVLCCVRAQIDASANGRIRELLGGGLNFHELNFHEIVAFSIQNGVALVVQESILSVAPDLISAEQRRLLNDTVRATAAHAMGLSGELVRVYRRFEAAGIRVVPYKGPVLATLAYGNVARRDYSDLDITLPQRYIPEATALLQSSGYLLQFDAREAYVGENGFAPGQYSFVSANDRVQLELHTERTLRYFPTPLDFQALNRRLIDVEIAGQRIRTFSVEDTLVMLCVHGAKHFWERLLWILDIAKLITTRNVDWALLMPIAARMESSRVVLLGISLAHEMLGAPLPAEVLRETRVDKQVGWLLHKVREQYEGASDPADGVWRRAMFRVRSRDNFVQAFRHMLRLTVSPTESDRSMVRLPPALSPLYTLIRPIRLVKEYGLGFRKKLKLDLAVYDPTPSEIVEHMLLMAEVSPNDVLCDLGCGDGRIVLTAARKYGIRAVGVDIDPDRIAEARANARRAGVETLVEFHEGNAKRFDTRDATVVVLYLAQDSNLRLAERLRSELPDGTRVISRNFSIPGWPPDRTETHTLSNGISTSLFLWKIRKVDDQSRSADVAVPELHESRNAGN